MLNKCILMGRLVADPELRRTNSGTAVCSFTLAVNRGYAKNGEQPQADFIDIVTWQSTAEFVSKWFKKGMQVAVSGRLQTRTWEDRDGGKRKAVEVVAEEVHFADTKKQEAAAPAAGRSADPFAGHFVEVDDDEDPFL